MVYQSSYSFVREWEEADAADAMAQMDNGSGADSPALVQLDRLLRPP